ncbi:GntR family transcriptional regulator [Spirochaeta lutea]|uniref:GntR family transcriptional regulator n=1 Tax=Spirochaeta lutea TaxID=1480694 RepID=A0A098R062_9SPIO|nr:GntR family transcriptional regulator [Spirochaeta lutea]
MDLVISGASDKPIYQQIVDQLSGQIVRGELEPGTMLPPIRTVAKELRISVITIKKAWEELEHLGFIYTMVGRGCFVANLSTREIKDKRSILMEEKIAKDITYYKSLGVTLDEIIEAIRKGYG